MFKITETVCKQGFNQFTQIKNLHSTTRVIENIDSIDNLYFEATVRPNKQIPL